MKITLERSNSKLDNPEEHINGLEDRIVEIRVAKRKNNNEDSLRVHWDNI